MKSPKRQPRHVGQKTPSQSAAHDAVTKSFNECIDAVTSEYDADILTYCGALFEPGDQLLIKLCRGRREKRRNILLILTTPGGSAEAAYRIARCLQRGYRTYDAHAAYNEAEHPMGEFLIYVHNFCKSAGTLLALGANRLIMSQFAELGPIDVQLRKENEVGDWTSGLTAIQGLGTLRTEAAALFAQQFREMRAGQEFSTKMATDIAAKTVEGLLSPIYSQIDPMRLGEIERFVRISMEYGERLATSNVNEGTVAKLVAGYPSHGFVIDRREARESLFSEVKKPSEALEFLGETVLQQAMEDGSFSDEFARPRIQYLNQEVTNAETIPNISESTDDDRPEGRSRARENPRPDGTLPRPANQEAVSSGNNGSKPEDQTEHDKGL